MDQFVQDQLKLIGLEHLIPLFRDTGYNEDSYRQLTLRKLQQLFPEEKDEDVVLKIINHVKSLNDPAPPNAIGIVFSPNVVAENEPAEMTPATSDDDEAEIVNITVRAPSGFTLAEVKQEVMEGADHSHNLESTPPVHNQQPVFVEQRSGTTSETTNGLDMSNNSATQDDANGLSGNNNNSNNAVTLDVEVPLRRSGRSQRRVTFFEEQHESQPQLKIRRVIMSNHSKLAKIQSALALARNTTGLKKLFGDNLEFVCEDSSDLNDALELLEAHCAQLHGVVKLLGFRLAATDTNHEISNLQISRIENLPEIFLNHLTKLVFDLRFPETTDFNIITTILTKCENLREFSVHNGVALTGCESSKTLRIPKMDQLVSFKYGSYFAAAVPDFEATFPSTNLKNRSTNIRFEINFGSHEYPELKLLCLGPLTNLSFKCRSQFPKLQTVEFGDVGVYHGLLATAVEPVFDTIHNISLPNIGSELIRHVDCVFPNLKRLVLNLPTFATLSTVIQALHARPIEEIIMLIGYEFESALQNALCGRPFRLVTENDKRKLAEMQQYAYWKEFMEFLEIELPSEELNNTSTALLGNVKVEEDEDMYICHEEVPTISWLKHLKGLEFQYVHRNVYLPENGLHWNNPEVQLSGNRWSTKKQRFPTVILLKLAKLKGTLTHLKLDNFEVDPEAAKQFRKAMGFKIELAEGRTPDRSLESFTGSELTGRGIKRELE